jgi:predicted nuclease with TOPRIM domain
MELMATRWTDDRMDDLKHQVDELGRRMEIGFAEQRKEMNARFDRFESILEARFDKVDERFDKVDERFDRVDERFDRVDERFAKVDERFERVDERFEKVDAKFEAVHDQIARTQEMVIGLHATLTRFSLGLVGAVIVAVVAALLAS